MRFLLILMMILTFPVKAQIKIIDGDSLEVDGQEIRLIGIDSPEYLQTCFDENNVEYECGYEAYLYLKVLIEDGLNNGEKLKCKKLGVDKYKRDLSECFIGNINVNRAIIKSGYAISYWDDKYAKLEEKAKKAQKGIFKGKFMRPQLYRILKKYEK